IRSIYVVEGDLLKPQELVATLDATLERLAEVGRGTEVEAAKAEVALLRAGTRGEEIRSMQAQVRAAEENEALVRQDLERERKLQERAATAKSVVEDLERRLAAATADREALAYRLKALRKGARSEEIERAEAQAEAASTAQQLERARVDRYDLRAPHQ